MQYNTLWPNELKQLDGIFCRFDAVQVWLYMSPIAKGRHS